MPPTCVLFTRPVDARVEAPVRVGRWGQALVNGSANGPAAEDPADDTDKVVGWGKPETKKFDAADFTALDVSSAFEVHTAPRRPTPTRGVPVVTHGPFGDPAEASASGARLPPPLAGAWAHGLSMMTNVSPWTVATAAPRPLPAALEVAVRCVSP